MGPIDPPPPTQERMRPILFCSWDLSEHEKWMPPSPNWDGLSVGRHFQYGPHRNQWNYYVTKLADMSTSESTGLFAYAYIDSQEALPGYHT